MTEKDLEIQELRRKVKQLENQKQNLIECIEKKCVWDDHLQGYCFDLKKSDVRTLMFKMKEGSKNE